MGARILTSRSLPRRSARRLPLPRRATTGAWSVSVFSDKRHVAIAGTDPRGQTRPLCGRVHAFHGAPRAARGIHDPHSKLVLIESTHVTATGSLYKVRCVPDARLSM